MSEHYEKGVALHGLGRFQEAEEEFLKAIAADSDDPEPRVYMVLTLLRQDKVSQALEAAKAAVALAPDAFQTHYVLAEALDAAKKYPQAEQSIQEALRIDPEPSDLHGLNATIALHRNQLELALERAQAGLKMNPESVRCLNIAGAAALNLKRFDEADEMLDRALALQPEADFLYLNKAFCATGRGDTDRAVEFFIAALRLNPNSRRAKSALLNTLESRNWLYMVLRGLTLLLMFVVAGVAMAVAKMFASFQSLPFLRERLQNPDKPRTLVQRLATLLYLPLLLAWPVSLLAQAVLGLLEMTETSLISLTLLTNPKTSRLVLESDRQRMKACFTLWELLILVSIVCAAVLAHPDELMRSIHSHY